MSVRGWATGARWEDRGSELTAPVLAGATTLPVENLAFFDDVGDRLVLNGEILTYTDEDEDTDEITVAVGPTADADVGDKVLVYDGGQVTCDYVLVVDVGPGDPADVIIPFEQRDMWPEGTYDDPVQVILSDDYERIESVPARHPARDAGFISTAFTTGYLANDDSWPNNTWTTINWVVSDFGKSRKHGRAVIGGVSATSLTTFTIDEAGVYDVRCGGRFEADGADIGKRGMRAVFTIAGVSTLGFPQMTDSNGITGVAVSQLVWLEVGDTVEFQAYQNSGASIDLLGGGANFTYYAILRASG